MDVRHEDRSLLSHPNNEWLNIVLGARFSPRVWGQLEVLSKSASWEASPAVAFAFATTKLTSLSFELARNILALSLKYVVYLSD